MCMRSMGILREMFAIITPLSVILRPSWLFGHQFSILTIILGELEIPFLRALYEALIPDLL